MHYCTVHVRSCWTSCDAASVLTTVVAWCHCTGAFAADKLEGEGTYTYSNGDIYMGSFKAGKKHGSGQLFFKVGVLLLRLSRILAAGTTH